jgi:hypothetical protein
MYLKMGLSKLTLKFKSKHGVVSSSYFSGGDESVILSYQFYLLRAFFVEA